MRLVSQLVVKVRASLTSDGFFDDFEDRLENSPSYRRFYSHYERAFAAIPVREWERLQSKAITHYTDHRDGQLKQGFFHQLNEAFAFEFLITRGFESIDFVDERVGARTPDLSYIDGGIRRHCEVKSIGISDDEIDRRRGQAAFQRAYDRFDPKFFKKLDSGIASARLQIASANTGGLVFINITPDDFSTSYNDEH